MVVPGTSRPRATTYGRMLGARRGARLIWARLTILVWAITVLVLGAGASAHAAYDPLNAGSFLTAVGGPFLTGANPSAVAYNPDGTVLATTNRGDDTVAMARVEADGSLDPVAAPYPTGDGPSAVAFSPDGQLLAVANETDGTVSMFFVTTDEAWKAGELRTAGTPQIVTPEPVSLAFSPDGRYLAIASRAARSATLYSVTSGGALAVAGASLPSGGVKGPATTVRFSSRGLLAVGREWPADNSFSFYRLGTNGQLTPAGSVWDHEPTLCDAQFSPDGEKFAWSNCYPQYDSVNVIAIGEDGGPFTRLAQLWFYPTRVQALAWSPDGSLLATANAAGSTVANPGPTLGNIPANSVSMFSVSQDAVTAVGDATPLGGAPAALAFSRDGLLAVAESDAGGTAIFRASPRGGLVPVGATPNPGGDPGQLAFSPGGTRVATSTGVFTVSTVGAPRSVDGSAPAGSGWSGVAFNPSGSLLARTNGTTGDVTLATDSASAVTTPIGLPLTIGGAPRRVAFSPDGTLLAVIDDTGLSMLRVDGSSGLVFAARRSWSGAAPRDLAFRPVGSTLTVVEDQSRVVTFHYGSEGSLDAPVLTPVTTASGSAATLRSVAYNADGSMMAAGDRLGRLWLFTVAADGQPTVLGPPTSVPAVNSVAFSPMADTLVVATDTGLAAYVASGGRLREIAPPNGRSGVGALAISPNGKLVVGNASGALGMWSLAAPWLDPRITSGPARLSTARQVDIGFSANYPARFECRLDGGAYAPCDSPWTISDPDDGSHVASVRGRDLSGVLEGEPATWHWASDVHGPLPPEQTTPAADAANLPPTGQSFVWSATTDVVSAVDRYELWMDQTNVGEIAAAMCSATCVASSPAPLAEGPHVWMIRTYDVLGHMTQSGERSFTVDATPPSAAGLIGPDEGGFLGDPRPRFSWIPSQDAGAGVAEYDVIIDGQTVATALPPTQTVWEPATGLAEGSHTWQVVARDRADNAIGSGHRSFTVDQTSPVAALRVSPARFVPPFKVTLDASGSTDLGGSIARYEFDLDGDGSYETSSANPRAETTLTTLGVHPLGVRVVDRVGRIATAAGTSVGDAVTGQGSHEASVTIDDGAEYTRSRVVSLTVHPPPRSGAVTMIISNDGQPDQALRRLVTQHVEDWPLAKGDGQRDRRIVYVVFYNAAGLQVANGRVQDDILYDPYAPTVKDAVLRLTGPRTARLSFLAKDRGSGLARWEFRSDKRTLARRGRFKGIKKISLPNRIGKLSITIDDKAGNTTRAVVRLRRR